MGGDSIPLQGGSGAGTFDLKVLRPGYDTWIRNGVQVSTGPGCRVETVTLEARLTPAS